MLHFFATLAQRSSGTRSSSNLIYMLILLLLFLYLQLRVWARRFFATLAQRSSGTRSGSNPIYNLLPDIMSALVREPSLDQAGFEAIMKVGGLCPYWSWLCVGECAGVQAWTRQALTPS